MKAFPETPSWSRDLCPENDQVRMQNLTGQWKIVTMTLPMFPTNITSRAIPRILSRESDKYRDLEKLTHLHLINFFSEFQLSLSNSCAEIIARLLDERNEGRSASNLVMPAFTE
jgi:hypothetical protein